MVVIETKRFDEDRKPIKAKVSKGGVEVEEAEKS